MRIKTIIVIVITIAITILLMENNQTTDFTFLFVNFKASKLEVMAGVAVSAFILGLLVGQPGGPKHTEGTNHDDEYQKPKSNTLSDEDREYIS